MQLHLENLNWDKMSSKIYQTLIFIYLMLEKFEAFVKVLSIYGLLHPHNYNFTL